MRPRSIYFNKSARDVNLAEAAMLAGLFKAPTKFAPHVNLPAARARANVVLDNLVEAGFMTEGQVFGARRNPATALDRRDERSPNYYLDYAFDEMKKLVEHVPEIGERARVRGAHCARCRSAARRRERGRELRCGSTAAIITPSQAATVIDGSRRRRARHGRRPRLRREPVQPRHRRAAPARLLVQALCLCHRADERHSSRPRSWSTARSASATGARTTTRGGYAGSMTLTQAITRSINVIPVKLSIALGNGNAKIGRAKIIETRARRWASARRCPTRRRCRSAPTR